MIKLLPDEQASAGWRDVLVEVEQVARVVVPLDGGELVVVAAVVVVDPATVVVGHEVDVAAWLCVRSCSVVVLSHPPDSIVVECRVLPGADDYLREGRIPVGVR